MQQSARWKTFLLWSAFLASLLVLLPSLIPARMAAGLPEWIAAHRLKPGLDLTGGSRLVLDISRDDIIDARLRGAVETIGNALRAAQIPYGNLNGADDQVDVTISSTSDVEAASKTLDALGLGTLTTGENGAFSIVLSDAAIDEAVAAASLGAVDAVRRRVESLGIPALTVGRGDRGRIVVSMPGLTDPQRVKDMLATVGKLSARLIDNSVPVNTAIESGAPAGSEVLYSADEPPTGYLVRQDDLFTAADVASARASADGEPFIEFVLRKEAAEKLAAFTRDNAGRTIAILLDGQVISTSQIQGAISDGIGRLSGDFDAEGAANLARVVASGPLPAALTILEERSIEPVLGATSIGSVALALAVAVVAVVAFITFFYGVLGIIASLALFFNVLLTFAALALIGAPLSLSMIAGVVLTMGLAVDASVLIFERIREEVKAGRPLSQAVSVGFGRARTTVVDASVTMLIAVAVLFLLSAAPVRGFALAVGVGMVATLFTTFGLTHRLVRIWLGRSHATRLPKGVRSGFFDSLNLRFMAVRNAVFLATAALSLVIAGMLAMGELRLGIDFTGGAAVEVQAKSGKADAFDISARLADAGVAVQTVDTRVDERRAIVRLTSQGDGENAEQTSVLVARGELEDDYDFRRVEVVGPSISGELIDTATLGFVAGLLALIAYIWVRFEWHFAIGAVIALAHDVFFTLGFLAVANIEFNISAVAALLTVVGYSLNDTMVVYDRIRENLRHFKQMPLPILIDDAINRTLSRTVLTSATTLIALAALALFGGEAIRTFALTLFFGVAVGTISSIYIAGPILILFRLRPERYRPGKGGAVTAPEATGANGQGN
ncbi:protein translocase subunit SecD [Shinella sp. H4-D48]|uniref:protein translocase subunit SecD n=1 Tax=Shinella sp. H4-D48 TaxID=2925841 RepID=UPI001F53DC87|nr:protein translocase subunit SecD [Shinella sp. H4-D48]UNK36763.1 protein translocase subunit SecD [Shinella sp. H4-D48]